MQTIVNGMTKEFEAEPAATAIDVLRDQFGLTGTKLACGSGVCGACTILVDGVPKNACLMPASHLDGADVRTVEAHGPDDLHPVQLALMAHDGLQCGFCTPGFVNRGIAFYDEWRTLRGKERPSESEIADALAGNLCRCAAYVGIRSAIADACEGRFDGANDRVMARVDALEKVTGEARYTVDQHFDGQVEGIILRSLSAHALIGSVDLAAIEASDDVIAAVDLLDDERRVRFVGQPILALAARDRRAAERALSAVRIDYDEQPPAIGAEAAEADDAPRAYVGDMSQLASAAEGAPLPTRFENNVGHPRLTPTSWRPGAARRRIDKARKANDPNLVEAVFHNAHQVHTSFEPHSTMAHAHPDGRLDVHASTQNVHQLSAMVAKRFDIPRKQITVHSQHVGGGFGGKQGMYAETIAACALSLKIKRPVRVVGSRLDELSYASKRSGSRSEAALLTKEDGTPRAIKLHGHADAGLAKGSMAAALYGFMSPWVVKDLKDHVIVNNTPPATPFRGPDVPASLWAMEQLVDEAADRHGIDPVALRRRWFPDHGVRNRLLDWVETIPAWRERTNMDRTGRFRRGIGLSAASWLFIYNPDVEVIVSCSPEGLRVSTATQDIGNGTRSSIAKAVEDAIGLASGEVRIDIGRSDRPLGPVAGGSQVTTSLYPPVYEAAEKVAAHLFEHARSKLGHSDASIGRGGVDHAGGHATWGELMESAEPFEHRSKRITEKGPLGLRINTSSDKDGPALGLRLSHGVVVSEVEVDTRLGRIVPRHVWTGIGAGRIFVPDLALSQVQGGVIQGLGYALYERKVYEPSTGHTLTANLNDYRLPGIGDTPGIDVHFDEAGYEDIAHGGIGIAELSTVGVAASVGNAVQDATGWRPLSTPITPREVIEGLSPTVAA